MSLGRANSRLSLLSTASVARPLPDSAAHLLTVKALGSLATPVRTTWTCCSDVGNSGVATEIASSEGWRLRTVRPPFDMDQPGEVGIAIEGLLDDAEGRLESSDQLRQVRFQQNRRRSIISGDYCARADNGPGLSVGATAKLPVEPLSQMPARIRLRQQR